MVERNNLSLFSYILSLISYLLFLTLAGIPTTIAPGGTSFVTTEPAPTIAFSPIVTTAENRRACSDRRSFLHERRHNLPIFIRLQFPFFIRGAGIFIVDERNIMADEGVILNRHAFANECCGLRS